MSHNKYICCNCKLHVLKIHLATTGIRQLTIYLRISMFASPSMVLAIFHTRKPQKKTVSWVLTVFPMSFEDVSKNTKTQKSWRSSKPGTLNSWFFETSVGFGKVFNKNIAKTWGGLKTSKILETLSPRPPKLCFFCFFLRLPQVLATLSPLDFVFFWD